MSNEAFHIMFVYFTRISMRRSYDTGLLITSLMPTFAASTLTLTLVNAVTATIGHSFLALYLCIECIFFMASNHPVWVATILLHS